MSAIEQLWWVLEGGYEGTDPKPPRGGAPAKLRRLLQRTGALQTLNPANTPNLCAFAASAGLSDGPSAVVHIRNQVVHPTRTEKLYERPGVVAEASRLAAHYLNLVVLHQLGYAGRIVNVSRISGWVGETEPAPWTGLPEEAPAGRL